MGVFSFWSQIFWYRNVIYSKLSKVSKTWKQLMFHHLGTDDIYGDGGSNLQVTGHTVGGRCGNKSGGDFLDFGK